MEQIRERIKLIRYLSFGGMFCMITGFILLAVSFIGLFTVVINQDADSIFIPCVIAAGVVFGLWAIMTFVANLLILLTKWPIPEFEQEKIMWAIFGFFLMGWIGSLLFTSKIIKCLEDYKELDTCDSESKDAVVNDN